MKKNWLLCIPFLCLFMTYCTKDPLDNLTGEESRIYVTNYDTVVAFNKYITFKIADSVAIITNNRLQGKERTATDVQLIEALATALQQRGFTRINGTGAADLGITISAITNTSTQLVSYTDYGGYYGGYWDPYYWGYPSYSYNFPTYYGIYETDETALAIDMVDLKNAGTTNNQLKVIWSGLIRGPGLFSSRNIDGHVSALLNQSPYLKR